MGDLRRRVKTWFNQAVYRQNRMLSTGLTWSWIEGWMLNKEVLRCVVISLVVEGSMTKSRRCVSMSALTDEGVGYVSRAAKGARLEYYLENLGVACLT